MSARVLVVDDEPVVCRAATRVLSRVGHHVTTCTLSILDFHWTVARPGGVEQFKERLELAQYTRAELLGAFAAAGFRARWYHDGLMPDRGLVVGTLEG